MIDMPDDFWLSTLQPNALERVVLGRLQDALDNEFSKAPYGLVTIAAIEIRKEPKT